MKNTNLSIFAASLLIAGAILSGFSLLVDSLLIFVGFAFMLVGLLLPFATPIARYFRSFSEVGESEKKD